MNALRKQLDALKRPFGKGQKLEKFAPALTLLTLFCLFLTTPLKKELISEML